MAPEKQSTNLHDETIFAPASGRVRAGVAVIRISGKGAFNALKSLSGNQKQPQTRVAALRTLKHPISDILIDKALVLTFEGPHSFTGEDVVELHIHGGKAVMDSCLNALAECENCRMAEPGEFTRRGFENGRMDLTEAEAVADLVDAETALQQQQALAQMGGSLSKLYEQWRTTLVRAMALMEADIDFPDEDVPDGVAQESLDLLHVLKSKISMHLQDGNKGERLRDGIRIAVIGAPNSGKSSLINALADRDVAIVSSIAGTTRDIIDVHLDINGFPIILSDTAGLRPDQIGTGEQDSIEEEGIRRALKRAEESDLNVLVFDGDDYPALNPHTLKLRDGSKPSLIVLNKSDRLKERDLSTVPDDWIIVSAKENNNLNELVKALGAWCNEYYKPSGEGATLTRNRHRQALQDALEHIERALNATENELAAEDCRMAARSIGRITGRVDVEDLLDVIFRDFCIGK